MTRRTSTIWTMRRQSIALVASIALGILPGAGGSHRAPSNVVLGERLVGAGISASPNGNGSGNKDFAIAGNVVGLYPGATRDLSLTVTNPNNFAIDVQSLTVKIGNASTACSARMLSVVNFSGSLFIPKNSSALAALPISMIGSAPNACENADWPLTFGGSAVKA